MTCAILTIGTELTRGELQDSNGAWLADSLSSLGLEVTEIVSVDDHDGRIIETLHRLALTHDAILCTGGLGPTSDDRTTQCVARAMGVPLVRDEASLKLISDLFTNHGRTMTPGNEKQADFPQDAQIFANNHGTAPGFTCQLGQAQLFVMPGVPYEMRAMFKASVIEALPSPSEANICLRLRCFGIPEAEVNDRLSGVEDTFGIQLGYRASNSEIEIKVLARGRDPSLIEDRAERAALQIEERLGPAIYARGAGSLSLTLGEMLSERHLTLGLAESCTGGLASQLITETPGASGYFKGSICCYSNSIKSTVLGVPEEALQEHGAVSEIVARQMAEGAKSILAVDLALAITGVAGPGGGSEDKPVGLVHFAVAGPLDTLTEQKIFRGTRVRIQRRAADHGLWLLRQAILS